MRIDKELVRLTDTNGFARGAYEDSSVARRWSAGSNVVGGFAKAANALVPGSGSPVLAASGVAKYLWGVLPLVLGDMDAARAAYISGTSDFVYSVVGCAPVWGQVVSGVGAAKDLGFDVVAQLSDDGIR